MIANKAAPWPPVCPKCDLPVAVGGDIEVNLFQTSGPCLWAAFAECAHRRVVGSGFTRGQAEAKVAARWVAGGGRRKR